VRGPSCPKLASFDAFCGCNYRNASRTCARPEHLDACSLPVHPLRKGGLNQTAYSLYLFLRDECRGDLVTWIDRQLADADRPGAPDRVQRMREALLGPLRSVHGIGCKIISMALADLLLGTDLKRERWLTTGASLIVIDTLVHNRMHRTGILRRTMMTTQSNRLPQLGGISIERTLALQTSASKAIQAVVAEAADHAKASFEQGVAVLEQLASAKTLDKGIEIQTAYAQNAYAALIARSKRIGEPYASLAKNALKPIAGWPQYHGYSSPAAGNSGLFRQRQLVTDRLPTR
jgi:hypothetical protein